jgi:hypothetical protein
MTIHEDVLASKDVQNGSMTAPSSMNAKVRPDLTISAAKG